jgi:hypothetical protein
MHHGSNSAAHRLPGRRSAPNGAQPMHLRPPVPDFCALAPSITIDATSAEAACREMVCLPRCRDFGCKLGRLACGSAVQNHGHTRELMQNLRRSSWSTI